MNGVPRATARAANEKRSIRVKVDTVVQPRWISSETRDCTEVRQSRVE